MQRIREHEAFLQKLATTRREKVGKDIIKSANPRQLDSRCEIILNVLRGNIPLGKAIFKKAQSHKNVLRKLAKKCLKKLIRKKLFIKYFTVIKKILAAVLPIIGIALSALQYT
jgi:hypothetical protein